MGKLDGPDDSFGDAMPDSAASLPSAMDNYVTEGLKIDGLETRVAEIFRSEEHGQIDD